MKFLKNIYINKQRKKYKYHYDYCLISDYIFPLNIEEWDNCPICKSKPKIWIFDNGRFAGCKCHNSKYDHLSIQAESIMSFARRYNGSIKNYDSDELRKNWNYYCKTGKIKFKPKKSLFTGKVIRW